MPGEREAFFYQHNGYTLPRAEGGPWTISRSFHRAETPSVIIAWSDLERLSSSRSHVSPALRAVVEPTPIGLRTNCQSAVQRWVFLWVRVNPTRVHWRVLPVYSSEENGAAFDSQPPINCLGLGEVCMHSVYATLSLTIVASFCIFLKFGSECAIPVI